MSRPLSPIEMLIDQAVGRRPAVRSRVKLMCPHCRRTVVVDLDPTDPPGTARVSASCDKCPDDAAVIDYFDDQGRQIDLDGNPMSAIRG